MPTVYAAFDSHHAVAAAVEQLHRFGFPSSAIHYEGDDTFRSPPPAARLNPGFLSTVQNFFTGRGSAPRVPPGFYAAVIRRGGAVLAVNCDSVIEERTARELLRLAGQVDPDGDRRNMAGADEDSELAASDTAANDRQVAVGGLSMHRRRDADETPVGPATPLANEADFTCFRPGIFEIRENIEVISLTKVARVVEELSVSKSVSVHTDTVTDILQGTSVVVEDIGLG